MKKIFKNKIISTAMVAMLSVSSFVGVSMASSASVYAEVFTGVNTDASLEIVSSDAKVSIKSGEKLTRDKILDTYSWFHLDDVKVKANDKQVEINYLDSDGKTWHTAMTEDVT